MRPFTGIERDIRTGNKYMKNNDRYKRLIKFGSAAVIMAVHVVLYYLVWTYHYNNIIQERFWGRGNFLLAGVYGAILFLLHQLYGGLKIGYLQRNNIIYSQSIALFAVNVFAYVEVVLIDKKMHNAIPLVLLFLVDLLATVIWAFLFQWIYNLAFPPRELLVVYGERPVFNIMEKLNSRDDKYIMAGAIRLDKGIDRIMQEAPKFGGVLIGDLPSHDRNLILKRCYDDGIRVYLVPKISDIMVRSSSDLRLFDTPILLSRNDGLQIDQAFFKRILDIVSAAALLILSSPFFFAFSLAIKAEDHGPVFYTQKRLTKDGAVFDILKFRTMRVNAEKDGVARLAGENDDRITKVGKILRATRLAELPQVLNILKGEMSMVGPRPERPEIAAEYEKEIPEFKMRLKVKAGLTGYAQIYGRYNTTPYDKLKLDLTYIRNYSFFRDLQLIFMTPKIMFMKESTEGVKEGQTTASILDIDPYKPSANLKEEVFGKSYALEEELQKAEEREKRSGKRNKRRKRR